MYVCLYDLPNNSSEIIASLTPLVRLLPPVKKGDGWTGSIFASVTDTKKVSKLSWTCQGECVTRGA